MFSDPSSEPNSRPRRRVRHDTKVVDMPGAVGRPLPHSLDAEESLLACILLDAADMVPRCRTARIVPDSFYDPKHGEVLATVYELYDAQKPVELATIAELLKTQQRLEALGSYAFLAQITARVPTTASAAFFLEQVRTQWILRQIIRRAAQLAERTHAWAGEPLGEFLSPDVIWFESALARVTHGGRGDVYTLEKRIDEVIADVAQRAAGTEDRSGWCWTGFRAFDDLERESCLRPFNSLEEDGIVLIGGGSSHGKSVLMRQFTGEELLAGPNGPPVAVYSLETSVKGFVRQLAASRAGVNLLALHRTPSDLLRKFRENLEELKELADKRLFIFQNEDGSEISTIEDLDRHARRFAAQHGTPKLMVVDYLQRLDTKKRYNSAEQRVAFVAHGFQSLQRSLGCCAIGGAQFNESALAAMRTAKRDPDGKLIHAASMPTRGALRESQALYHDCDVALFLYRPPENSLGQDQSDGTGLTPEMWIVQDKRRNGVLGACRTHFQKQFGRFREIGADESASAKPSGPAPVAAGARVSSSSFKTPRT